MLKESLNRLEGFDNFKLHDFPLKKILSASLNVNLVVFNFCENVLFDCLDALFYLKYIRKTIKKFRVLNYQKT